MAGTVGWLGVLGVVLGLAGAVLAALAWLGARRLRGELDRLRADPAVLSGVDPKAVRNLSVVRYDAFAEMGGRMSYSVALLDSAGDGVVLTAINGRSETRAYAKGVTGGASEQTLSPEEHQALDAALGARYP
ncbi:MAG: DUF4446 family protein [Nocardioidaceae bacterium]